MIDVPDEVLNTGQWEYFIKTPDNKRIPVPENRVVQAIKGFGEGAEVYRRFVTSYYKVEV